MTVRAVKLIVYEFKLVMSLLFPLWRTKAVGDHVPQYTMAGDANAVRKKSLNGINLNSSTNNLVLENSGA